MRRMLWIFAPLLMATTQSPPSPLAPYIRNGHFDPGDFGWLRGKFVGASPAEQAAWQAILAWRQKCRADDLAAVHTELAAMGVKSGNAVNGIPYSTLLCDQVASEPEDMDLKDWPKFSRDVTIVTPIAQGLLAAVALAEDAAHSDDKALGPSLIAHTIGEQALRGGIEWVSSGAGSDMPRMPVLTAQQRAILVSRIWIALAVRDHANADWLKQVVSSQGWPKRSEVGALAASDAWLLAQHADADPAFQVKVLRLMEPLVKLGEVDRKNYAYLYDRVMLKIAGKQRYATQMMCRDGALVPLPLENERDLEQTRKSMGLGTMADYKAKMADFAATCRSPSAPKT